MPTSSDGYLWQEPSKPITRGAFIVIEGLDRAGKTTQVKALCDTLYTSGRNIIAMRFPDRSTSIGSTIDTYLQSQTSLPDHSIHLLFSANRWELASTITTTLSQGYTIICDRYYHSGMIYSASKNNPSLSLDWARNPEVGLPMPDVVVFLDLEPEEAQKRGGYGEERYEKKEMQERVRKGFLGLMKGKTQDGEVLRVVDAGRKIEDVKRDVEERVLRIVEEVEKGERGEKVGTVR